MLPFFYFFFVFLFKKAFTSKGEPFFASPRVPRASRALFLRAYRHPVSILQKKKKKNSQKKKEKRKGALYAYIFYAYIF
jgi:hypothetical protein